MRSKNREGALYLHRDVLTDYATMFSPDVFALEYSREQSFGPAAQHSLALATDGSFLEMYFVRPRNSRVCWENSANKHTLVSKNSIVFVVLAKSIKTSVSPFSYLYSTLWQL